MIQAGRYWWLGLLSLVFVLAGMGIGNFYFSHLAGLPSLPLAGTPSAPVTVSNANRLSGDQVVLNGSIVPVLGGDISQGTHKLVDGQGKVLAYLVSRKLDLNFIVPGLTVEVRGQISKHLSDGLMLLEVQSLGYHNRGEGSRQ